MAKKPFVLEYWDDDKDKLKRIGYNTYQEMIVASAKILRRRSRHAKTYIRDRGELIPV